MFVHWFYMIWTFIGKHDLIKVDDQEQEQYLTKVKKVVTLVGYAEWQI